MKTGLRWVVGVAVCLVIVSPVFAASPELQPGEGEKGVTKHVVIDRMPDAPVCSLNPLLLRFRASGATGDGAQGAGTRKEASSVLCTNFGTANSEIEVQVINWNGTELYCGDVVSSPSSSYTFSTQNTTIYFDDVILGGSPGTLPIFQGSILIWSDSGQVRCTAQTLDPLGYPPVFVATLELYP